jgi:hypothetical protein
MRLKYALPAIVLVLSPVFAAMEARAQYANSYGYSFNNPVSASANAMFWNSMNARAMYRAMLKKRGYTDAQLDQMSTEQMKALLGAEASAPGAKTAAPGRLASKFTMGKTYLLLPDLVSNLSSDPKYRKALLDVLIQGMQAYEKDAAPDGFDHDVAGAMTFFISSAYYIYREGEEPDDTGSTIMGRAIQQRLDTPEFAKIGDADKQKFYEFMIGMGTYLLLTYKQAVEEKNAEAEGVLKSIAADTLKAYLKLDPETVRITANGLEGSARR